MDPTRHPNPVTLSRRRLLAAAPCVLLLAACGGAAASAATAPASSGAAPAGAKPASAGASASASAKPAASPGQAAKPAASAAASGSAGHLVVAYGQPSMQNSILWIAQDQGLFKKYGVDTDMTQVTGPAITQGLIAGQLELIFSSPVSPMTARLQGGDTLLIGSNVNKIPTDIVVNPKKIQSAADLKGKLGGVQQAGDLSDEAVRLALAYYKLTVNDVQIKTGFNTDPTRLEAMLAGAIDFAPIALEYRDEYTKQGLKRLISLEELDTSRFLYGGMFTSNKIASAKPAAIEGASKALAEALHVFHTKPDVALSIAAKYTKQDPAKVKIQYDAMEPVINKTPEFNRDDVVATLKALELATPSAKDAKPDEFYTTKYIDLLNSSGFLKQLAAA
jgi:ABC-type nitrate/sulfonate/bicarbonate transport system substrate-binding protein